MKTRPRRVRFLTSCWLATSCMMMLYRTDLGRIILGIAMDRQRAIRPFAAALLTVGVLAGATACGADNSLEAAQTAVTVAQTVVPGAQATAQSGATLVSNAITTAQPVILMVQG